MPVYPECEGSDAAQLTLEARAEIRVAPWLGPHGVFTLDRADVEPLIGANWVPCVDTDDIIDGVLRPPGRVALRTDGDTCLSPAVATHLAERQHLLTPGARRRGLWRPPESWGLLPLAREALLVPRIAKELRTVRLPAGVLPINHNLTILWRTTGSLDALDALLHSPRAQAWVRRRAARLEKGYLSITTSLLRRLPLEDDELTDR
jgi:hypothetical protein